MGASRRELTKTQNRETILAAAKGVFAQMGFASATVRDIIRATPLASGTFYNYFKSKEEVYQALRDGTALAIRPRLREVRLAANTAEEFLSAGFRVFFEFVLSQHDGAQRGETAPAMQESRFRMDSPQVLAGFAELREDLDGAVARGLLPSLNTGLLAGAITGMAFELAEQVKSGADVDETARLATALLLGGIGALAGSA
ncbi:MAG TPA: TetR/AcrR family transcriptional regulator [Rhizomicrobium sp.]|nr:TetR/AcrR family transcriptional regulator [Rhizomicrobium sp.]